MNRFFYVATLTVITGWLPVSAATTTAPANTPAKPQAAAPTRGGAAPKIIVPDPDVPRYLTPEQRAEWSAALQKLATAQTLMRDAEWNLSRTQPKGSSIDFGVDRAHKIGAQQKAEADALRKDANLVMNRLRAVAATLVAAQPDSSAGREYVASIPSVNTWGEVLAPMTADLVRVLREANYNRYYLLDVVSFENNAYAPKADLTKAVSNAMVQADGDKFNFMLKREVFKLAPEGGKLILDFPTRQVVLRANKVALIVGEAIYEPASGYAFFSLRAVDLADMRIVANRLAVLRLDPALGDLLGISAEKRPILADAPAAPAAGAPAAITVRFQDAKNFVGQINDASRPFVFRADTKAGPDTLEGRLSVLLLKQVIEAQDNTIPAMTDADFLARTLPLAVPSARDLAIGDANASWVIAASSDTGAAQPLRARSLDRNTETDVGSIVIERNLEKLTFPEVIAQTPQTSSRTAAGGPIDSAPVGPITLTEEEKKKLQK